MKTLQINLLFILFLSAPLFSQEQHFTTKESPKYRDQFKSSYIINIHTTDEKLNVIARKSKSHLVFESFDEEAKGKKLLLVNINRKESYVGELFYDHTYRVFLVESPSKTERILHCYTYNVIENTYTKTTLLKKKVQKKGKLFSGENKRQTNFSVSPDNKYIAIAVDNIKKNSNSYDVYVYNASNLTLAYTKSYYSNTEKFYTASDMVVDDDGTVYHIGKEYFKGRRERKKAKANYSYVLSKIEEKNVSTSKIELTEDEFIKNLNMSFINNKLRLIGYYSKDKAFGIKGVSTIYVDKSTLSLLDKKKQELPLKVFEDLYGYRSAKSKKDSELTSFDLDYLLEDEDGNTYLVAEEFYVVQMYVPNGMYGGTYVTTFHYDDILITKLDAKGNLLWGRSIFKRANKPSYNAFLNHNELHVVLNSGKKLLQKQDGRLKVSKGWFESTALYVFLYDKNGNVTHEKIQDNKKRTKYTPYTGSYADGKFVMYNHSMKSKKIMLLTCKEK